MNFHFVRIDTDNQGQLSARFEDVTGYRSYDAGTIGNLLAETERGKNELANALAAQNAANLPRQLQAALDISEMYRTARQVLADLDAELDSGAAVCVGGEAREALRKLVERGPQ